MRRRQKQILDKSLGFTRSLSFARTGFDMIFQGLSYETKAVKYNMFYLLKCRRYNRGCPLTHFVWSYAVPGCISECGKADGYGNFNL